MPYQIKTNKINFKNHNTGRYVGLGILSGIINPNDITEAIANYIENDMVANEFYVDLANKIDAIRNYLFYVPMAINNFRFVKINGVSNTNGQVEKGTTVTSIEFAYDFNQAPRVVNLKYKNSQEDVCSSEDFSSESSDNITVAGLELTDSTANNIDLVLTAYDSGVNYNHTSGTPTINDNKLSISSNSAEKSLTLKFLYRVYYGYGSANANEDEANFLSNLTASGVGGSALTADGKTTFTVTAGSNSYIWFVIPSEIANSSQCKFTSGGFTGGFNCLTTLGTQIINDTSYHIYRSTQSGLGKTTISVTL